MTNSYAPSRQPAPRNRTAASSLTNPVRYPSGAAAPVLTKRAFLLILMTLLVPGTKTVFGTTKKWPRWWWDLKPSQNDRPDESRHELCPPTRPPPRRPHS